MNQNLVPTPIVNKNGVPTTVHKKAPQLATNSAAAVPAPSLKQKPRTPTTTMTPEQRAQSIELFVMLSNQGMPLERPSADNKLREGLNKYSDELLVKLLTHAQKDDTSNGAFLLAVEGKTEEYMHTYLALHGDKYDLIFETGRGYSFNLPEAVDSLAEYTQLPYEHSDDYYQKAIALTGVVAAIQYKIPYEENGQAANAQYLSYSPAPDSKWTARLSNNYLVDFILERPDQWEEIADIITTRHTQDPDVIQPILDYEVSAMRDGTL